MIDVNYLTSPSKMQDTRDMVNIIAICKKKLNDNQNNFSFPLFALAKSLNKYKALKFLAFLYIVKKNANIWEYIYIYIYVYIQIYNTNIESKETIKEQRW